MKTLVICRPAAGVTGAQIAEHGREELDALRDLRAGGLLLEAYSPGGPGAVLVFAENGAAVECALESLPLRQAGLIQFERITLRPFPLG